MAASSTQEGRVSFEAQEVVPPAATAAAAVPGPPGPNRHGAEQAAAADAHWKVSIT
jgi:hypothetical protein